MNWPETNACASRLFCQPCRTSRSYREQLVRIGLATDPEFACPYGATAETVRPRGAGTELTGLLGRLGITPGANCDCKKMADQMDRHPPEWSLENTEQILAVMAKEAGRRKLPFVRPVAVALIKLAVRRARSIA